MTKQQKYIILDFGLVLGKPKTGEWFITPNFFEILGTEEIDLKRLRFLFNKFNAIISVKMTTREEEYEAFKKFYYNIITELNITGNFKEQAEKLAQDFVYNEDKYAMYDDVYEFLSEESKKHTLILLSDNWPCVYNILKKWNIYDFFNKIYISSEYCELKKDGKFFERPINDFKIKENEAIFVDDNSDLLEVAEKKNLIPILMDRANNYRQFSKYRRIINLKEGVFYENINSKWFTT